MTFYVNHSSVYAYIKRTSLVWQMFVFISSRKTIPQFSSVLHLSPNLGLSARIWGL